MYLLIWTPIWLAYGGSERERVRFGAVLIEPLVFLSAWRPEWIEEARGEARRGGRSPPVPRTPGPRAPLILLARPLQLQQRAVHGRP